MNNKSDIILPGNKNVVQYKCNIIEFEWFIMNLFIIDVTLLTCSNIKTFVYKPCCYIPYFSYFLSYNITKIEIHRI